MTGDLPTGRSGRTTGVDARPIMLHYQNIYGRSDPQCCYSIAQGQVPSDHADAWCCAHCCWGADHCPRGNRLAQIWILGRDATFYVLVLGGGSPEIANLWLLQQPLTLILFGLGVALI